MSTDTLVTCRACEGRSAPLDRCGCCGAPLRTLEVARALANKRHLHEQDRAAAVDTAHRQQTGVVVSPAGAEAIALGL